MELRRPNSGDPPAPPAPPLLVQSGGATCPKGHRLSSSFPLCLSCLSSLLSSPLSLSHHLSFALSQLSLSLRTCARPDPHVPLTCTPSHPHVTRPCTTSDPTRTCTTSHPHVTRTCDGSHPHVPRTRTTSHPRVTRTCEGSEPDLSRTCEGSDAAREVHVLGGPLVRAMTSACERGDDELAKQAGEAIVDLVNAAGLEGKGIVVQDLVRRICVAICEAGSLLRRVYELHCFGILLSSYQNCISTECIKDKYALFSKLLDGLHLPSEELRGEILFVLYRLSLMQATPFDDDFTWQNYTANLSDFGSNLLRNSLDVLLVTQSDDVRLNCIAFLLVLAKTEVFDDILMQDQNCINFSDTANEIAPSVPLVTLFSDAVKGSLLSSNSEVQIGSLDLISHFLSCNESNIVQIQSFIEENIADYVFEALRLSGKNDALIINCIQVLSLLSLAEESFKQKLSIGFQTIISSLNYVSEIPFHSIQPHVLKLVLNCLKDCTGIIAPYQIEGISQTLTLIFRKPNNSGDLGTHLESFILANLIYVEILKSQSARDVNKLPLLIQEALNSVISSIGLNNETPNTNLILHSLYFLKEAFIFTREGETETLKNPEMRELETHIVKLCEIHLLPFLEKLCSIDFDSEEILISILEIFHTILLTGSEKTSNGFANLLAVSSWFEISFTFLGAFNNSDALRSVLYLIHGSIVDRILGTEFGDKIRDACVYLPSDPLDLVYLLGQKSLHDLNLAACQNAVIVMLYVGSLYGERFADETQILSSIEQYILLNSNNFTQNRTDCMILTQLILLYSHMRNSLSEMRVPHSQEAEKTIFHLITYKDWDLISIRVDPLILKWLFEQEEIIEPLSNQILNFCRSNYSKLNTLACVKMDGNGNGVVMDVKTLAELAVCEGNLVISVFILLLGRVVETGRDDDVMYVVSVITEIVRVNMEISNRFCLCGIVGVLSCLFGEFDSGSCDIFLASLYLVFDILYFADFNALIHEEEWLALTVKLLSQLDKMQDSQQFNDLMNIILAIFCMILHQSTNQVLKEAAKAVLLNGSLICLTDRVINEVCQKGPALSELNEETVLVESLIFVLLLSFFSLKSLNAILKSNIDWQDSFQNTTDSPSLSVLGISCRDLCKILRTGSIRTKIIASQCLFELFTQISDQIFRSIEGLKCSHKYLQSVISVIEGFVFYENRIVSKNCCFILATILSWEGLGFKERRVLRDFSNKWCRLIIEEFFFNMSTNSGLASKEFTYQQNGLVGILISVLKWETVPIWVEKLFGNKVINGILSQIKARNVTGEIVRLFRVLMDKKFLNQDHVATLHHLFQICRRQLYEESAKNQFNEDQNAKMVIDRDEKLWTRLMHLMLDQRKDCCEGTKKENQMLLNEIDLFFQESGKEQ